MLTCLAMRRKLHGGVSGRTGGGLARRLAAAEFPNSNPRFPVVARCLQLPRPERMWVQVGYSTGQSAHWTLRLTYHVPGTPRPARKVPTRGKEVVPFRQACMNRGGRLG